MTVTALLGPTNTGKTHRAIERMLEHPTGMIGLPLRLLAREVYDRITARLGERQVALVTGEEKRVPPNPRYWVCTVESMPVEHDVDFLCVDEVQLAAHEQRGHTFTDRLLHARGLRETWLLGSDTIRPLLEELLPAATIVGHPRFSDLAYTGTHGLAALPPRTAVVAFSAEEVYAIAERLRRRHGGTAVVLGALSPRTRNAQVAMYQAGEVDHMVATDAIGMGLNMDVDRVVFASLDKFDGKQSRPLDLAEIGQIAGRAGRFTTAGGFGTLKPLPGLPPRVVLAVESHRFPPARRLVWRSPELDFSSVDALVASLRVRPKLRSLRLVEQADDFDALCMLARSPAIRERARDPSAVRLLWDVCRIPDFRKLLLESHVQLLAEIYDQITSRGAIDPDWMSGRLRRFQAADGDIETLMTRIAFIRTWTYVSNQERWVVDAPHWQAVTRELEDRHSDALHERLTERFVDRPGEGKGRASTARRRVRAGAGAGGADVETGGSPFDALRSLEALLPDPDGGPNGETDPASWVNAVVDAPHSAFSFGDDLSLRFGGEPLARLRRGVDLLHPEVTLVGSDQMGAGGRLQVLRRVRAWLRDAIDVAFSALRAIETPSAEVRGLSYQLERGLGSIGRDEAAAQLERLSADDRRVLADAGIVLGECAAYLPSMCKPAAVRLRAALWVAAMQPEVVPAVPPESAVSVRVAEDVDPSFYEALGFFVIGPLASRRAIRVDQLERVAVRLRDIDDPVEVAGEVSRWLGVKRRTAEAVLRKLGWPRAAI
jgi:ATP-dependent RNA helicase SUPV3L1/SUV3